jgi:SET domain-containing protein
MLKVRTYLDRSPIHGIGLFSNQKIMAGSMVWEFNPAVDLVYSLEQWDLLKASIAAQSFVNLIRLSYKEKGFIVLCMDNAQFMNHSEIHDNVVHGVSKSKMHAVRNIARGEELLCNYLSYSDPDDFHAWNIVKKRGARQVNNTDTSVTG